MSWQKDARAVLALTRAVSEALARSDLETAHTLLDERQMRVHCLGETLAGNSAAAAEAAPRLAQIRAAEKQLEAALSGALGEAAATLARLRQATQPARAATTPQFDQKA